jgi:hypothetical protein
MAHKFIRCGECYRLMQYNGKRETLYCDRCCEDRAHIPLKGRTGNLDVKNITPIGEVGFIRF